MPEWMPYVLTSVLTFLGTGGGLAVWCNYRIKKLTADHRQQTAKTKGTREARGDEIDVLQSAIADLRADNGNRKTENEALRRELTEYRTVRDKDFNDLKDEHTACLIEQERLKASDEHQKHINAHLSERVKKLETEVAELRGAA